MTLPPRWEERALALVEQASHLAGEFFRSVELAYGHPDDVISGEGTHACTDGRQVHVVSKTSMLPLVRSFEWQAVEAGLEERPALIRHRDDRGRNWLHICCASALDGRSPKPSIRTADVLLGHGIDLHDHAFTEGRWRATPVWFCIAFGRNLALAEHLMKLGASPQYSLYAAAYNRDADAIRLLVRYGADIEEPSGPGQTPLMGAVGWSHFEAAEAMLRCGANVNAQDDRGMTAAHMMLKKNSDYEHFALLARHKARFDLPDKQGITAADIMSRKRDPRFHQLVAATRRAAIKVKPAAARA